MDSALGYRVENLVGTLDVNQDVNLPLQVVDWSLGSIPEDLEGQKRVE